MTHSGADDDFTLDGPSRRISSADDALAHARDVIGSDCAGPRSVWCFIVDRRGSTLPLVLPVPGVPVGADAAVAGSLTRVLARVVDDVAPEGQVFFALSRRGGGDLGRFEESWSHALATAATVAGLRLGPFVAVGEARARVLDPLL